MCNQKLGWMAISFGRNMDDSPMVVVWPSCGADGEYNSVALSQRKMPYEVMPTPDPHPPFALAHRYLCHLGEPPHSVHAERAAGQDVEHHLGIQPHAPGIGGLGCSHINTPKNRLRQAQPDAHPYHPRRATSPLPPVHPRHSHSHSHPEDKGDDAHDDEKAEDEGEEGESHDDKGGGGSSVSFVHGALCTVGLLLVLPSGALMVQYAKATGSPMVFLLHRLLPFGVGSCLFPLPQVRFNQLRVIQPARP
ncbi:hypothetical protein EDB85DRAFT_2150262 [Lactarius pseudohatsudake]|nr:hypothetical protein EDB85DRAFT_2150262 [Lactarius pseudohatsudake]